MTFKFRVRFNIAIMEHVELLKSVMRSILSSPQWAYFSVIMKISQSTVNTLTPIVFQHLMCHCQNINPNSKVAYCQQSFNKTICWNKQKNRSEEPKKEYEQICKSCACKNAMHTHFGTAEPEKKYIFHLKKSSQFLTTGHSSMRWTGIMKLENGSGS